ncbi:MAG: hypothetical protein COW54_01780 [Rhodobacteraceae bacterium CG17_big_fil_post_rev_8_21_14_2_50_63_15]|nr:hypothetical protein [Roseovarius sp.]PIV79922.1 MAG: hypothetical protein COW54_01780 [Rhodobacteraceae bacterium CG17_big_fil_post_rev_8_21_14_2_50_63_15]
MKLGSTIALRQQVRMGLSPHLQTGLAFMAAGNLELARCLEEAAADNPWLELRLPMRPNDAPPTEAAACGPTLHEHVLLCLPTLIHDASDQPVALAIIEELDSGGFMVRPLRDIAARCGVPTERVEGVLRALQRIEPRGLFARSVSECLALQLTEAERKTDRLNRLLRVLPMLTRGGIDAVALASGLSVAEVKTGLARLRGLDPRPAACFAGAMVRTRVADLIFVRDGSSWQVTLNPDTTPRAWMACAVGPTGRRDPAPSRSRREAHGLVTALERRNLTLLALGEILAHEQGAFLSQGEIAQRPLTQRAVARVLRLHESTIGRMVNACAAATPQGIMPLQRFFCRAVRHDGLAGTSAPAMIARIARLIATEVPQKPLSDDQIAAWLSDAGWPVSRRVAAKLRARAGIGNRSEPRVSAGG